MGMTHDSPPPAGVVQHLAPDLRCILAPNASPMTYWGTNTYLLGTEGLAIIDPGPDDPHHLRALLCAIGEAPVEAILLTHSHIDHSPLARALAEETGAPVLAFGDSMAGRSPMMRDLADQGLIGGGEGVDQTFTPTRCLKDGERLKGADWSLRVLHTPGHMGNHLCFASGARLFCGDHVMGWASTMVSPPDGDLTQFMASCARLLQESWQVGYPAHGAPMPNVAERLEWLVSHRQMREAQILEHLDTPRTAQEITRAVYHDVPEGLLGAAERNVFAHLIDLFGRDVVAADPAFRGDARFVRKKMKKSDLPSGPP